MQRSDPKVSVLVISTQTPTSDIHTLGLANGKTGQVICDITAGGLVYMHRNKQLSGKENAFIRQHLVSGGWLVITGHGGPESDYVGGAYAMYDGEALDIECSAEDYVELVMASGALVNGDGVNILLYVCYGATLSAEYECFASKLSRLFSVRGIGSNVVASTNQVGRLGGYDAHLSSNSGRCITLKTASEDIRLFTTLAGSGGAPAKTIITSPGKSFMIASDGLKFTNKKNELTDEELMGAVLTRFSFLSRRKLKENFNVSLSGSVSLIKKQKNLYMIRKSSMANHVTIVYQVDSKVMHHRIQCVKDEGGTSRLVVSEQDEKSIAKIISHDPAAVASSIRECERFSLWVPKEGVQSDEGRQEKKMKK